MQHAGTAARLTAFCLSLRSALLSPCTVGALDDACAGLRGGLGQPAAAPGNNLGLVATGCKGTKHSEQRTARRLVFPNVEPEAATLSWQSQFSHTELFV
jgi:hypothetical protein